MSKNKCTHCDGDLVDYLPIVNAQALPSDRKCRLCGYVPSLAKRIMEDIGKIPHNQVRPDDKNV